MDNCFKLVYQAPIKDGQVWVVHFHEVFDWPGMGNDLLGLECLICSLQPRSCFSWTFELEPLYVAASPSSVPDVQSSGHPAHLRVIFGSPKVLHRTGACVDPHDTIALLFCKGLQKK